MKYLIAIVLLIAVVANGITGYKLFTATDYDLSHVLVVASYACIVASIYFLTVYKQRRVS